MEAVHKFLFAILISAALMVEEATAATQHAVGGSQGWDESTDFSTWASGQKFVVGDQLVFKYTSLHSVVEVGSESAYKSCDISSALNSLNGGNSVVKLTKPGTRYFACGTSGHCGQGMKVKITTVAADASSSTTTTPASSSSSSSSSPTSTSAASVSYRASMATALLVICLSLVSV
ncbi:mavicyanin isoform X2 [Rhododendron vialii]|uniref:mavicyanin isoform X2 n=1 Tax=Rhododendron vialii TaxID=182163 RepID=UPI00265F9737|nr:mavicyanin isoform X2 [Rhododendron vialii]